MATKRDRFETYLERFPSYSHMILNQVVFISSFAERMVTKFGGVMITERRFTTQTLTLSRTSCYILIKEEIYAFSFILTKMNAEFIKKLFTQTDKIFISFSVVPTFLLIYSLNSSGPKFDICVTPHYVFDKLER